MVHAHDPPDVSELVIYGSGGFARETAQLLTDLDSPSLQVRGFLDDDTTRHGQCCWGLPILGDVAWLATRPGTAVVIAVGSPRTKQAIANRARAAGATFPTLVHPSATVGQGVTLGNGCIICGNCILTTDITVGLVRYAESQLHHRPRYRDRGLCDLCASLQPLGECEARDRR